MWLNPHSVANFESSAEENCDPLSEMTVFGVLWVANESPCSDPGYHDFSLITRGCLIIFTENYNYFKEKFKRCKMSQFWRDKSWLILFTNMRHASCVNDVRKYAKCGNFDFYVLRCVQWATWKYMYEMMKQANDTAYVLKVLRSTSGKVWRCALLCTSLLNACKNQMVYSGQNCLPEDLKIEFFVVMLHFRCRDYQTVYWQYLH